MIKKILCVIFIAASFGVFAQTVDPSQSNVENAYESFKKEFHKELGDTDDEVQNKVLAYRPIVKLPNWFINFKNTDPNTSLSVGISDPGLDSLKALEQATIRALAIAAFSNKSLIQNVSDNYYLDNDGAKTLGKFISFTYYSTQETLGLKLLEYEYTSNGEMLVLIDYSNSGDTKYFISSNIELFQSETSGKVITRLLFEADAQSNRGENFKASWLVKENKNSYEIESEWDGESLEFFPAKYRYVSDLSMGENTGNIGDFSFDMKYGLWYAYINALAANMEQMEVFNSQVKFLDDKYDRQFQDLTRIVFTENTAFNISGIAINDNELTIKLVKD